MSTETKHTHGPWKCMPVIVRDQIAYHLPFYIEVSDDQAKANAQLISAAPDMLEALKAVREVYAEMQSLKGYQDDSTMIKIKAAINKAEGK